MGNAYREKGGSVDNAQWHELMGLCVDGGPIGHVEMKGILAPYRKQSVSTISTVAPWQPWKKIVIGGVSRDELIAQFAAQGCRLSDYARSMMMNEAFTTEATSREITLARGTLRSLGFTKDPTTAQILDAERLARYGLSKLPSSAVVHLRFVYQDQLVGERLVLGTDPISDPGDCPFVFKVDHDGGERWLSSSVANSLDRWNLGYVWVFAFASNFFCFSFSFCAKGVLFAVDFFFDASVFSLYNTVHTH